MTTDLRELLVDVAQSDVPPDLAQRAIGDARTRRRQRLVVGSAVLAAAAVVLGVVIAGGELRTNSEPRPSDVASLPSALPAPGGLPTLTAESMDFASAAYVVEGEVVVIDAETGTGALVDFGTPEESVYGVLPGIGPDASAVLSPNGRFLMVSSGDPNWDSGSSDEWMWMVDVATGTVALQTSFQLAPTGNGSPALLNRMAWSPNGASFACVCSFSGGRPRLYLMQTSELDAGDLLFNSAESDGIRPRQISWGVGGLVAQLAEDGAWGRIQPGGALAESTGPATSLAMSAVDANGFLGIQEGGTYRLGDIGQKPADPLVLPAGPVLSVQAYGAGFVLVSRPSESPSEQSPTLVAHVMVRGDHWRVLSTFPAGTTSASLASGNS